MWCKKKREPNYFVEVLDGNGSTIDSWESKLSLAELREYILPKVLGKPYGNKSSTTCISIRITEVKQVWRHLYTCYQGTTPTELYLTSSSGLV